MPTPSVLLADLDDTLFDHAHATRAALAHLREIEPSWAARDHDAFIAEHNEILELLHQEVLTGRLTVDAARVERFRRLLRHANEGEQEEAAVRAVEIARSYRAAYERAWQPVPGAIALLTLLRARDVRIVVVTNNLQAEQELKMGRCGLMPLVDVLVTSERAGVAKPDARIFAAALEAVGAGATDAVMLGDAWSTDILGAIGAGIRPVWLNRLGVQTPDPSVQELRSLMPLNVAASVILGHR